MLSALKKEAENRMLAGKKDPTGEIREGVKGEATERAGKVGQILGPPRRGERTDLSDASDKSDGHDLPAESRRRYRLTDESGYH